jgi:hypothetical protein
MNRSTIGLPTPVPSMAIQASVTPGAAAIAATSATTFGYGVFKGQRCR